MEENIEDRVFDNRILVKDFVENWAIKQGRCVSIRTSRPTKVTFNCVFGDKPRRIEKKQDTLHRKRSSMRTGCPYKMYANLKNEKWRVEVGSEDHNHEPLDELEMNALPQARRHNLKKVMHRFEVLKDTNLSSGEIASAMSTHENIVFRSDVKNQRNKLKQLGTMDSQGKNAAFIKPFILKLEENNYITCQKFNEKNELTHLFFAHSTAIEMVINYRIFD